MTVHFLKISSEHRTYRQCHWTKLIYPDTMSLLFTPGIFKRPARTYIFHMDPNALVSYGNKEQINSESCCCKCHWLHARLLSVMYSSGREVFLATARGESEGEQCDQTITSTAAGLLKRDALHGANGATVHPIYTQGKTWTRLKTVHFSVFMYGPTVSPSDEDWCWPEYKNFQYIKPSLKG